MTTADLPTTRTSLPTGFRIWVSGIVVSVLGNGMLLFALGWTATAHSGALAGLVLTAVNLPRALLLLVGGAIGDRFGARPVLIAGDAVMTGLCVLLALALHLTGPAVGLLLLTGLVVGVVDAFYLPASGSMPRLLVAPEHLSRALGVRQGAGQVASLASGPLCGLVVVPVGLAGVLLLDAATFAAVLVALLVVRPVTGTAPVAGSLTASAWDGLRLSLTEPMLRVVVLLMGAAGGLTQPVLSIVVPLLAREHGWSARGAGLVIGAQAVGVIVVSLLVARHGTRPRAAAGAATGTVLCAAGLALLALARGGLAVVLGATAAGVGLGVFASHIGPAVLSATPATHLSRVQAMLTFTQTVALLVTNNVVGPLADAAGAAPVTLLCAFLLLLCGLLALWSHPFRSFSMP